MSDSFAYQLHSDEFNGPTQEDWNEYHEWVAEQDAPKPQPSLFVTDCDYCGHISLCFESEGHGTCCHSCSVENDINPLASTT